MLSNILAAPKAEAACDLPVQGGSRVSAIVDARTLRLDDDREVHLAGIEMLHGFPSAQTIAAALRTLADGPVILKSLDDTPDRYGRQSAWVTPEGTETTLQSALVSKGLAVMTINAADRTCILDLRADEAAARSARRGLWAAPGAIKNAEDSTGILAEIGRFVIIEGTVRSARQSGGTLYLNFGKRWIQGFAVTISRRMMASFAAAGLSGSALENRRVRVRGWVERRGGPRIEALQPEQIEMIGDDALSSTVTPAVTARGE